MGKWDATHRFVPRAIQSYIVLSKRAGSKGHDVPSSAQVPRASCYFTDTLRPNRTASRVLQGAYSRGFIADANYLVCYKKVFLLEPHAQLLLLVLLWFAHLRLCSFAPAARNSRGIGGFVAVPPILWRYDVAMMQTTTRAQR